jgi:hypothetical protein
VAEPFREDRAAALSASRSGDNPSLDLTPFGDNTPGHTGAGFWPGDAVNGTGGITGSYTLDVNGTKVASGNADQSAQGTGSFITTAKLPAAASTVSLTLNASRAVSPYVLSTVTSTTWTWRSAHEKGVTLPRGWICENGTQECDAEPLLLADYTVAGLGLNGVAPAGAQGVRLQIGHQQLAAASRVTAVSAQVSFDGGASWQPAMVTGSGGTRQRDHGAPRIRVRAQRRVLRRDLRQQRLVLRRGREVVRRRLPVRREAGLRRAHRPRRPRRNRRVLMG